MPKRLIACVAALGAVAAWAEEAPVPDGAAAGGDLAAMRQAVARGEALPLSEIMPAVMAAKPGKIIDIRFELRESGPVYVIYDLTPDWQLFVLTVDARTGSVVVGPLPPAPAKKDQS